MRDDRKMLRFIPQTQLFGATAAAPHYKTVSRLTATSAVRWLRIPRLGHFDNFGRVTTESTTRAFTSLNDILGFELKEEKSACVTVCFAIADSGRATQLSIPPGRVKKLSAEIGKSQKDRMRFRTKCKNEWANLAQTSVMGKVGRVALRPLYDMVKRGGGKLEKRAGRKHK